MHVIISQISTGKSVPSQQTDYVVITSKQCHFDVITSKWPCLDVTTTTLLFYVMCSVGCHKHNNKLTPIQRSSRDLPTRLREPIDTHSTKMCSSFCKQKFCLFCCMCGCFIRHGEITTVTNPFLCDCCALSPYASLCQNGPRGRCLKIVVLS